MPFFFHFNLTLKSIIRYIFTLFAFLFPFLPRLFTDLDRYTLYSVLLYQSGGGCVSKRRVLVHGKGHLITLKERTKNEHITSAKSRYWSGAYHDPAKSRDLRCIEDFACRPRSLLKFPMRTFRVLWNAVIISQQFNTEKGQGQSG